MVQHPTSPAIVIVHGLLGFGRVQAVPTGRVYFSGLRDQLGANVHFPTLPGNGRIVERAQRLAAFLDTLPDRRIAIVAHSMGGLDARHLIHALDPQHRVVSLTTLSTPHRGSAVAAAALAGSGLQDRIVRALTRPALDDLHPDACAAFNDATPDREDVRYRSYSAARPLAEMPAWLRPFARQFGDAPNDGLVTVTSAQWGTHIETLHADHFELAGWRVLPLGAWRVPRFEHLAFYRARVTELRSTNPTS